MLREPGTSLRVIAMSARRKPLKNHMVAAVEHVHGRALEMCGPVGDQRGTFAIPVEFEPRELVGSGFGSNATLEVYAKNIFDNTYGTGGFGRGALGFATRTLGDPQVTGARCQTDLRWRMSRPTGAAGSTQQVRRAPTQRLDIGAAWHMARC